MGFRSILWQILYFRAKQWIKDIIKCCHWARTSNIGLLYPTVCNNIAGDIPIDVLPPKYWGMCPQHSRQGWRQWTALPLRTNDLSRLCCLLRICLQWSQTDDSVAVVTMSARADSLRRRWYMTANDPSNNLANTSASNWFTYRQTDRQYNIQDRIYSSGTLYRLASAHVPLRPHSVNI